jgi:plastocyanin
METIFTAAPISRRSLATLGKLTALSLVGSGFGFIYLQAFILQAMEMPLPVFTVLALSLAAIVATGFRPLPLLGSVFGVLTIVGNWQPLIYDLKHPENTHTFGYVLVMLALAAIQICTGIGATAQNYRSLERRAPRFLSLALTALAAVVVGATLVAAIPREAGSVSLSADIIAQFPAVTIEDYTGRTVRVKAGELVGLRLENSSSAGHSFDVDALNVHAPMQPGTTSVAVFRADTPGTFQFYCEPHFDKATGQGMHGTLVVEP